MALVPEQLYTALETQEAKPGVCGERIQPKTFAAGTGTLAVLTPVAFNTSTNLWAVWDAGGSNGLNVIRGFVWADDITLSATGEVIGNVLMEGTINYSDIVLPTGELEADLKAALRSGPRDLGILIQNLSEVR
jgi:hypothetical protein